MATGLQYPEARPQGGSIITTIPHHAVIELDLEPGESPESVQIERANGNRRLILEYPEKSGFS